MDSKSRLAKRLLRLALGAFLAPLFSGMLFAQTTGTGSISGRVFDSATGKSLQGAVVRVPGTSATDITTSDGRFMLSGVPAGAATVQVEYVGLDPMSQSVTVPAGGMATVSAGLESKVLMMETLTVSDSIRGQALAINQQKTAAGIINIVSEETFGAMVDGNVAQALQRLPGITANEDADGSVGGFNIRGIEGAYNSFQVDGNRVPNSGTTGRAFNPRQVEASGITNIEVIKAPTPDRDGDAIGGIINVVSRSAFQRDGRNFRLKLAGVYSDLPGKWGHSASLSYSDIFSVAGRDKNLGVSLTLSSHKTDRYSINADQDWIQVTPANNPTLNLPTDRPVWFFEATHFEHETRITNTKGISSSIDFRTDEHNSFYLRPSYSFFDRKGITFETDMDIDTRFQDAVGGRKTYALLTPDSGRATPGSAGSRGSRGWIGTDDDQYNKLYSVSMGGKHERPDSLLTYDLFYSFQKNRVSNDTELNTLMEPDAPWIVQEYKIHDIERGEVTVDVINGVDISNLALMTEGELIEESSRKTEDVFSARADWEKKFATDRANFTLKTGAKFRSSKPFFDRLVNEYTMDEDFPYSQIMKPTDAVIMLKRKYYDVYPRVGQALLRSQPSLFEHDPNASVQNSNVADYDASEDTSAAYAMGTLRFGPHTVIGGVRFEKNEWSSTRKDVRLVAGGAPVVTPIHRGASYDYWLPGLHLRHELRPNLILRESFNQSYGRANLAQLTRGRLVAINGNITDGNENLQPAFSNNFDVQLEYYTANGGLYSAGVFYKDVEDFTFSRVGRFNTLDANGIPVFVAGGAFQYTVPQNGSTATNKGLELIARQRMYFLPGPLKGFSVALSATFTRTAAEYPNRSIALGGDGRTGLPLPGFSKKIYTAALEYAWRNFSSRIDYRYRDEYVEGLGANIVSDEFFNVQKRLEAEVNYRLRKGVSVYASGTNLTDEALNSYQGYAMFIEDSSISGRKFTVGMEFDF